MLRAIRPLLRSDTGDDYRWYFVRPTRDQEKDSEEIKTFNSLYYTLVVFFISVTYVTGRGRAARVFMRPGHFYL